MGKCVVCKEDIPDGKRSDAEYCGKPKCKSKAYRDRKKEETEQSRAKLTENFDGEPSPLGVPPTQVGTTAVSLHKGQQTIVLRCTCGAHTTIYVSHAPAEAAQSRVPESPSTHSTPNESEVVANPIESEVVANPIESAPNSGVSQPASLDSSPGALPSSDHQDAHLTDSLPVEVASPIPSASEAQTDPVLVPARVSDSVAMVPSAPQTAVTVSSTTGSLSAFVEPPKPVRAKPNFVVFEVYFTVKKDRRLVLREAAKTSVGTVSPAYDYHVDKTGLCGYHLARSDSRWMSEYEHWAAVGRCQLSNRLIVWADKRFDGTIGPYLPHRDLLAATLGDSWPRLFHK